MIAEAFFKPLKIGGKTIRNRVVKSPQSSYFWELDQSAGQRAIDFYESLAKGGTGLVVVGAIQFFPCEYGRREAGLHSDFQIEGFKKLTDAVHAHGSTVIAQFNHDGASDAENPRCSTAHTAAELPCPEMYCSPCTGVSHDEIAEIKQAFVNGAIRAKKAGFDGVEVHSANAYFLLSFLSRIWNKRDDEYGPQNMENRTRLQREVVSEIRKACGDEFIIGIRMNGQEFGHERAMTIDEGVEAAKWFEKAGVDYLSVTGYGYGKLPFQFVADYWAYPEVDDYMKPYEGRFATGLLLPAAQAIRAAVNIPVLAGGRLDEKLGAQAIIDGKVDAVLFGRPLWADPELGNKIERGELDKIVHCTHCATCEHPFDGEPRRCRVNPSFGRERELEIKPADTKKNVVVVGGGPAGMEAARVASLRGHKVTLLERESVLGGHLPLATMVKGSKFDSVFAVRDYLVDRIHESSVDVRLKTAATKDTIASLNPDVVIVATGGIYASPYAKNGVKDAEMLAKMGKLPIKILGPQAIHSLSKIALPTIGKNVAIIGGQIEGVQGAVFLAERGRNVTLISEDEEIGDRMPPRYLMRDEAWFQKNGIEVINGASIKNVSKKSVALLQGGKRKVVNVDSVLVFMTPLGNDALFDELKGCASEVVRIGAANGPATSLVVDALREGREVGTRV